MKAMATVRCKPRLIGFMLALIWGCVMNPSLALAEVEAAQKPGSWTKEIPIEVFIEEFAAIDVHPDRPWQLHFAGQGSVARNGPSIWRFLAEPTDDLSFTIYANTNVQVSLSGGGGLKASDTARAVNPIYYFIAPNEHGEPIEYRYASGETPRGSTQGGGAFPVSIQGPTGDAGVTFSLSRAEILASSLMDVEAGALGTTTLVVTVAAAGPN